MADKTIPADKVRELIALYRDGTSDRGELILDALEDLLLAPPTLADMNREEREACRWMQADTEARGRVIITTPNSGNELAELLDQKGGVFYGGHSIVTPLPDLPRMTWPVDQEATPATTPTDRWRLADHPEYGRVIVIRPTPRIDGKVLFMIPDSDPLGYDRRLCNPDELTFLNNDQEA